MPPEAQAAAVAPKNAAPPPAAEPAPGAAPVSPAGEAKPGADSAAGPAKAKDRAAFQREGFRLREERKRLQEDAKRKDTETATRFADLEARLKASDERAAKAEADRQAALEDPVGWAAKNGRTPEQTIQHHIAKDTPEAAIAEAKREAAEAKKAAADLAKQRDEDRAALAKEREEEKKQATQAAQTGACKAFVQTVANRAKEFPYLNSMYDASEIEAKAAQFQAMALAEKWTDAQGHEHVGKAYSFDEVAKAFEGFAKRAYDLKEARRLELLGASSEEAEPVSATGVQAKPALGKASQGKPAPKPNAEAPPKATRRLTRAEQEEEDLRALRAATAKDRAAK